MSTVIIVPRNIGPVNIAAFLYENHKVKAVVTDNAIEDGSSVSDHMYIEPKELILEVADEKASDAFIGLVEHQALREPFDVISGLSVYPDMVIWDINADRDARTSKILRASIHLREVIRVGTASAIQTNFDELPPTTGPSLVPKTFDQTNGTTERGDTAATEVEEDKGSSIL